MSQVPQVEDAISFIVEYVRGGRADRDRGEQLSYGYDIYIRNVLRHHLRQTGVPDHALMGAVDQIAPTLSPVFCAAAWELCRRGVLRPGVRALNVQATTEGSGGTGFSITPRGREWLESAGTPEYVPLEPGRFARMLAEADADYGPGFVERSQEAVRAYNAQAFLACCAMCGAAAESLVLTLAVEKVGDESVVLRDYESRGGRGRIERSLLHGLPAAVEAEFRRYTDLLKYWRDSAAHGRAVHMTEAEAFGALLLLLRFAIFAREHRAELGAP